MPFTNDKAAMRAEYRSAQRGAQKPHPNPQARSGSLRSGRFVSWLPSARFLFAWYDLWIGAFWDGSKRRRYILPLPCVGVILEWKKTEPANAELTDAPKNGDQ